MNITLTESDLEDAVRLYIANSGVFRSIGSLEFVRKLKGEDAGISVSLELTDAPLNPEYLEALALDVAAAREINQAPAAKSTPTQVHKKEAETPKKEEPVAKAVAGGEPTLAVAEEAEEEDEEEASLGAEMVADEEIPFTSEAEDAELAQELDAAEEQDSESPFKDFDMDEDDEPSGENHPEALNSVPAEDADADDAVQYEAGEVTDPFGEEEVVTPIEPANSGFEEEEEEDDESNLFG